jgi:hypothetical protein
VIKGKNSGKCSRCIERNISGFSSIPWNKGITWTKKYNEKHRDSMYLNHLFDGIFVTKKGREKQRKAKLGKCGKESNAYVDGRTTENKRLRGSDQYRQLRLAVFKRDNYTCQLCSIRGGKLEMDHIKEWCNYPLLRFEDNNCRTLCKSCHKQTSNYMRKAVKKVA